MPIGILLTRAGRLPIALAAVIGSARGGSLRHGVRSGTRPWTLAGLETLNGAQNEWLFTEHKSCYCSAGTISRTNLCQCAGVALAPR